MVDERVFENKTFLLGKNTIGATDVDSGEESGASDKDTDVDALLSALSLSSEHPVKAIGIDELDNGYSVPDDRPQASPSCDLGASVDSAPEFHRRVILESRQRMRRALVEGNFGKPDGSMLVVRAVGDIRDYASEEDIMWLAQKVHHTGAWDFLISREEFNLYYQRHGKDVEGKETSLAVRDLYRQKYAAIAGGLSEQAWWDSEDSEEDLITHAFALTDNFGLPSRVSNAARCLVSCLVKSLGGGTI